MPAVSVLMPVFNSESTIASAVESILHQSFKDFELVIVDDGSTDRTKDVLASIKDRRIQIIALGKNVGVAAALNRGLAACTAPLVARMDSDDVAIADRLELQVSEFTKDRSLGVIGSYVRTTGPGNVIWKQPLEHRSLMARLIFSTPFHHPTVMFSRERLPVVSPMYEASFVPAEDYRLWAKLGLEHSIRFKNLPIATVIYQSRALQKDEYREIQEEQGFRVSQSVLRSLGMADEDYETDTLRALCGLAVSKAPSAENLIRFSDLLRGFCSESELFQTASLRRELALRWYFMGKRLGRRLPDDHLFGFGTARFRLAAMFRLGLVAHRMRKTESLRRLYGLGQSLREDPAYRTNRARRRHS